MRRGPCWGVTSACATCRPMSGVKGSTNKHQHLSQASITPTWQPFAPTQMVRTKELREGGSRGAGAQDSKDTGSGPLGPQQGGSCVQLSEAGASPRPAGTGFAGNEDKEQEPWVKVGQGWKALGEGWAGTGGV